MVELIINPCKANLNKCQNSVLPGNKGPALLWIDEDENDSLLRLHERYAKRAIAAHGGRTRNVFEMPGGYVVKVPKNLDGFTDNDWEGSVSNSPESLDNPDFVQYPRTRLVYTSGIPIVFMETIKHTSKKEIERLFGKEPDWTMSVDCGQVGVNRKGRLVAYDYGLK